MEQAVVHKDTPGALDANEILDILEDVLTQVRMALNKFNEFVDHLKDIYQMLKDLFAQVINSFR